MWLHLTSESEVWSSDWSLQCLKSIDFTWLQCITTSCLRYVIRIHKLGWISYCIRTFSYSRTSWINYTVVFTILFHHVTLFFICNLVLDQWVKYTTASYQRRFRQSRSGSVKGLVNPPKVPYWILVPWAHPRRPQALQVERYTMRTAWFLFCPHRGCAQCSLDTE